MTKPALVVFDIGRVMIRLVSGWRQACELAQVPYTAHAESDAARAKVHEAVYLSETGRMPPSQFYAHVGSVVGLSADQTARVMRVWLQGAYPGLEDLIDRLKAAGMKTACLSNTNALHWELMHGDSPTGRLPMHKLDYRIASHLVGAFKPEPQIYEALESQSGMREKQILFFDDLEANCIGARERGWHAHQIVHPCDPVRVMQSRLQAHGVLE